MADLINIISIQLHGCINFEIKGACIELVINNVLPQHNNVKIKLNLKVEEICRGFSPDFLRNK